MSKNKKNANKILGERLHQARKILKKTQVEMATYLGYENRNSISYFERGEREIPKEVALKISQEVGWNIEYLLDSTEMYKTQSEKNHAESKHIYETDHIFWDYLEHIGFGSIRFILNEEVKKKLSPNDLVSAQYIGSIKTPTGKEIEMSWARFIELQDEINDYITFKFDRER